MNYYLILLSFFIGIFHPAIAQDTGKITGLVQTADGKVSKSATVSLIKAKDSSLVKFTATNETGHYSFEKIPAGDYRVSITSPGYVKAFSPTFHSGDDITVETVILVPDNNTLSGVTVTAKKPFIEHKVDRTIINVDASITNVGTNALEVLEKSPGITVDNDGNISLKGKSGILVLVDGRPTHLSGEDLANMLKNMSSSQLDQVEIMTNPPARYDAAGNAGIINLKTRKNKIMGYSGTANANFIQGIYPKTDESFSFNYRNGKVNLTSNFGYSYWENFEKLTISRVIQDNNGQLANYFDQVAKDIKNGKGVNGRIGMDYFANPRTSFGISLNGISRKAEMAKKNETLIYDPSKELENITLAGVDRTSTWKNFSSNLYFRRALDTSGREFTTDLDYATYSSWNDQFMVNSYFNENGSSLNKPDTLTGVLPQEITIYSGRMDYFHPLKNGSRFEAGIKSSLVKTDNNVTYDSIVNGNLIRDIGRSNHFIYEENINAAYVNLNRNFTKKLSAQLGLRLENTISKGYQLTTGEEFRRNYTQLFPTAYFLYKANKSHSFSINYGRRITRPNYSSLNPFIRFLDRYTYSQGNPDLKPQFSHNIELTHNFKNFLSSTLDYSIVTDLMESVIEQKGREAYQKRMNLASQRHYGLSIGFNKSIRPWWMNNAHVNFFYDHYKALVNGTNIDAGASGYVISTSQQFRITKTFSAEINAKYRSGFVEGVVKVDPIGVMAIGFSKQVMKKAGMIKLTLRDVLYSAKFKGTIKYGNVDARIGEINDTRVIALGFSYRFSKGKTGGQKRRTQGSANEEQNRVD